MDGGQPTPREGLQNTQSRREVRERGVPQPRAQPVHADIRSTGCPGHWRRPRWETRGQPGCRRTVHKPLNSFPYICIARSYTIVTRITSIFSFDWIKSVHLASVIFPLYLWRKLQWPRSEIKGKAVDRIIFYKTLTSFDFVFFIRSDIIFTFTASFFINDWIWSIHHTSVLFPRYLWFQADSCCWILQSLRKAEFIRYACCSSEAFSPNFAYELIVKNSFFRLPKKCRKL